jgi:hypothetical protein
VSSENTVDNVTAAAVRRLDALAAQAAVVAQRLRDSQDPPPAVVAALLLGADRAIGRLTRHADRLRST